MSVEGVPDVVAQLVLAGSQLWIIKGQKLHKFELFLCIEIQDNVYRAVGLASPGPHTPRQRTMSHMAGDRHALRCLYGTTSRHVLYFPAFFQRHRVVLMIETTISSWTVISSGDGQLERHKPDPRNCHRAVGEHDDFAGGSLIHALQCHNTFTIYYHLKSSALLPMIRYHSLCNL